MRLLRTPDERFADLPGFNYKPEYATVATGDGWDGRLRVGYVQVGPVERPVVLLHSEPNWSFLYRARCWLRLVSVWWRRIWSVSGARTSRPRWLITAMRGTSSGCARSPLTPRT